MGEGGLRLCLWAAHADTSVSAQLHDVQTLLGSWMLLLQIRTPSGKELVTGWALQTSQVLCKENIGNGWREPQVGAAPQDGPEKWRSLRWNHRDSVEERWKIKYPDKRKRL